MKKLALLPVLCIIALFLNGCKKNPGCTSVAPSVEATQMLSFATARGMNVTADASGVYYEIINPGAGANPDLSSNISVTYKTWLVDATPTGTLVDEQTTPSSPMRPLNYFIEGWQSVLPLIQEGGEILIVPSALAFGCEPHDALPGNSILYYEIQLIDVN